MVKENPKNQRIADSRRMTALKRSHQTPLTIELKVNNSRLNQRQKEFLKMVFVEAKWSYNWLITKMKDEEFDIFSFKGKELDYITHKDKDKNDVGVKLNYLGSSMKDSLVSSICSSIKTLSSRKKKGFKVGALKYQSDHKSLFLKQYGITHKIEGNKIKIQGCKKPIPVSGLKQLKKFNFEYELSTMVLFHRDERYYMHLLVWIDNEDINNYKSNDYKNEQIGLDLGCTTQVTCSNGEKLNASVEESERLKRLQRKRNKQKKDSNSRYKTGKLVRQEYYKLTCKKNNLSNQLCHKLLSENKEIIMQDEQLSLWKVRHGKKIQYGILGRVKQTLSLKESVHILNKFVPTTKFCSDCGHIHKDIKLCDRQFVCPECGCVYDRDIHAAQNMVFFYNHLKEYIGVDGSEFKRADFDERVKCLYNTNFHPKDETRRY